MNDQDYTSAKLAAIDRTLAVIEFQVDGTIITANDNFCRAVGYDLNEIVGQHHRMFLLPEDAQTAEYAAFWQRLANGEFFQDRFRRVGKGNREIWIQATYNPIFDEHNKPVRVVKFATDITEQTRRELDFESKIAAMNRSFAVVEFKLDGTVTNANDNFCATMGYSLSEVQGRHHRQFVSESYGASSEYEDLWRTLRQGDFVAGEFQRFNKAGEEIWLQASYNPVFDSHGKAVKVVKYAVNISEQKRLAASVDSMMADAGAVIDDLAKGNLTRKVAGDYAGSLADLQSNLNGCIDTLTNTVSQIRSASASIQESASEISEGNLNLSHRTEQQAASLEETASSMEALSNTVQQNADSAKEANQLSNSASEQAQEGGAVVARAVSAMRAINDSSKEIADIIGVIEEIAFQTNLLALNAAVEAARAGEQGRGFAVVASEVRNLAQRSSAAAKDITALIKDSVGKVEEGSKLVNESGETLSQIVASVEKVSHIIGDIMASEEQSSGIREITTAVRQMDQVTQQNAALVEEAASASESMDHEARGMLSLVSFFRLSGDASPVAAVEAGDPAVRRSA